MNKMQNTPEKQTSSGASKWIKRFGVAGFLFFLIKGLVWLAIFIGAAYFGLDFLN